MKGGYHNAVQMAKQLLERAHAEIITEVNIDEIQEDGVILSNSEGQIRKVCADTVVIAMGFKTNHSLYEEIKNDVDQVYIIGDAVSPRNVYNAIHSAYEVASSI